MQTRTKTPDGLGLPRGSHFIKQFRPARVAPVGGNNMRPGRREIGKTSVDCQERSSNTDTRGGSGENKRKNRPCRK